MPTVLLTPQRPDESDAEFQERRRLFSQAVKRNEEFLLECRQRFQDRLARKV